MGVGKWCKAIKLALYSLQSAWTKKWINVLVLDIITLVEVSAPSGWKRKGPLAVALVESYTSPAALETSKLPHLLQAEYSEGRSSSAGWVNILAGCIGSFFNLWVYYNIYEVSAPFPGWLSIVPDCVGSGVTCTMPESSETSYGSNTNLKNKSPKEQKHRSGYIENFTI